MISIIQAAGWPIWPLILCSVAALALVIERFISLRQQVVAPATLLDEVMSVTRRSLPSPDVVSKLADSSVLAGACSPPACAPSSRSRGFQALRQSFENAGREAIHGLERYLNALATIATAAPLMGLFGTVGRQNTPVVKTP